MSLLRFVLCVNIESTMKLNVRPLTPVFLCFFANAQLICVKSCIKVQRERLVSVNLLGLRWTCKALTSENELCFPEFVVCSCRRCKCAEAKRRGTSTKIAMVFITNVSKRYKRCNNHFRGADRNAGAYFTRLGEKPCILTENETNTRDEICGDIEGQKYDECKKINGTEKQWKSQNKH